MEKIKSFRPSAGQIIVLSFVLLIGVGALLLMLPAAQMPGKTLSPLEAVFMAASAVCVNGLVLVEPGAQFSLFGQLVMLALIQIGGLGFMTITMLVLIAIGKRITMKERMIIQESFNAHGLQGLVRLILQVCKMVLMMELGGAVLLSVRMIPCYGWAKGMYYALFHSISAFCNAGFDVLGTGNSMIGFQGDALVMITLMLLTVLGGLGFPVIMDLMKTRRFSRLQLHSKVVLSMSALLLLLGFVLYFIFEIGNPLTLGDPQMSWPDKLMNALFQSATVRTGGFASLNQADMTAESKLLTAVMTFIGASPTSTGGGIKTTTFACVLLVMISAIRGKTTVDAFGRRLETALVIRSVAIFVIALAALIILTLALTALEPVGSGAVFSMENIILEAASALGTAGMSAGITAALTVPSKILLILSMFIGRVGPLTLALVLSRRLSRRVRIEYPEDKIIVG